MIHDMRSLFAALMLVAACGGGDVTPPPADPCAGWPAASFFNASSALQACLDAGGDPNARDDEGRTPLHKAATAQNAEAIRALLAAGARMGTSDYYGRTPLCVAAEAVADADVMHALLSGRPIIDTECQRRGTRWTGEGERPNGEMVTALCLASGYNSPVIVGILLYGGASVGRLCSDPGDIGNCYPPVSALGWAWRSRALPDLFRGEGTEGVAQAVVDLLEEAGAAHGGGLNDGSCVSS